VIVPHAAVSVAGGIQPGTLRRLSTQNLFDSGMVARILFAMPPRTPKTWSDDEISAEVRAATVTSLDALYGLAGEQDEDGEARPVVVKLSAAARGRLKAFVDEWGRRQFEADGERAAALAKLEALPGRFALIHHCVLKAPALEDTDPIGLASLEAGIKLAKWAANEADRVYAVLGETDGEKSIRTLFETVCRLAGRNGGRVTVKQLQNANSRKYRHRDDAEVDLERLRGYGLGHWEGGPEPAGGGKRVRYFVPTEGPHADGPSSGPRSDPTSDDSDHRPHDGEDDSPGGSSDDRSDRPDDRPPTTGGARGKSADGERGCGERTGSDSDRSSESSEVGSDREAGHSPPPAGGDPESVVGSGSEPIVGGEGFTLITSPADVVAVVGAIEDDGGPVGLDTETTGLDPLVDRVRLLQVATGRGTFVIDVFALPDPPAALAELFAVLTQVEVLGHNLQFDLRFLARLGFTPGRMFDTMLASQVLHAGERGANNAVLRHGLKDVVARQLDRQLDKAEQKSDWSRPLLTLEQLAYAAADAEILVPLAEALRARLTAASLTATAEVEMRALPGVAWAAPVRLDAAAWTAIADTAAAEQVRLAGEMDALAPSGASLFDSRNWNSTDQVKTAFAGLGVTLDSTDDDALAAVDHPLAALLRDYRAAAKRVGTYGRKWLAKHAGPDGRVLPSWNQLGAGSSGRMSCSAPNLQNVPRGPAYRRCFVAGPGNVLVKADYSQIELRIAAKITGERRMLDAYRTGQDLHTLTAAALLGKPAAEVTKADRQLAKAVNFGLLYGQGADGLREYALSNYGVSMTADEAARHRRTFFRTYPGLRRWHRSIGDAPTDTRTLGGRRRVGVSRFTEKLNTPVQGTGADGLKAAIALLWERRAECPAAVPVLFVHDEIVLEVPEADADAASAWLKRCMVDAVAPLIDPVPVEVEVSVGKTWGG
jgi:DNA polymerase-1